MNLKLIAHTENPEKVIALAGKLCYSEATIEELEEGLTQEVIEKFVNKIFDLNHQSVLEHVSFTFAVEGISRISEQQLTRHRMASYSIKSGRYTNNSNAKFHKSNDIIDDEYISGIFDEASDKCLEVYNLIAEELIYNYCKEYLEDNKIEHDYNQTMKEFFYNNGFKKEYNSFTKKAYENARMILPNSLETKIIFTMNLRSLVNFFEHRCCQRAQEEIRELAFQMLSMLQKEFPLLFKRLGAPCKTLGYCPEGNMQCDKFKGIIPTKKELYQAYLKMKQLENK